MPDYSLTYDQMKRYARMIILRSGMFNFTPPIWRICRNSVKSAIRNVIDGVHLLCMPSFFAPFFLINNVESKQQTTNITNILNHLNF